jgi:predicted nucleotidyltransferase
MALSKKYLAENKQAISFSVTELGTLLKTSCPEISFALLMGSAVDGVIRSGSDLDLAIYLTDNSITKLDLYKKIYVVLESLLPDVRIDISCLNDCTEPVFRFESLKGNCLFFRNEELWLRFYSVTCREYEHQMFHYKKQHKYRMECYHDTAG